MRLSLKTRFTLAASLLVLLVVAVVSMLYLARLTRQTLREATARAQFVAQQAYAACQSALDDAARRGNAPASLDPEDVRSYVNEVFDNSSALHSVIGSAVGYSPTIYEITVSDRGGIVLLSSDPSLRGTRIPQRPPIASLTGPGFFRQLRLLYGPPQIYQYSLPFNVGNQPFGDIRVGLSSVLIRDEISPGLATSVKWAVGAVLLSTLLAFAVTRA